MKCKMCFVWKNKNERPNESPTLNEWYNFFGSLPEISDNSMVINFSGAEPLFDERNLMLINFSTKRGFFTTMCTNAFLIDEKMAYKIADSGLNVIIISLDGVNKNTHDFLRGRTTCYDKAMQAINNLGRHCSNIEIGIQTIILERNLDEIIRLVEWVEIDKRIKFINFQAIAQPFEAPFDVGWYKKSKYRFLWPQDIKKVYTVIEELIKFKKGGYKISNPISQLEAFGRYFENPQAFIKESNCNVGFYINITQSGNVYICRLKDPIGNIKKGSPKEIWYSEAADRVREEIENCRLNCHLLINCCYERE